MDIFKEFQFDLYSIITIVLILIVATIVNKIVRWVIQKFFIASVKKLKIDETRYKFFINTISSIIWVLASIAIVSVFPKLKAFAITLFAGAGILVAVVGFAAQQAFSNIISGIFIVIFKPFRVGDLISVGSGNRGIVEDITLRHTVINDFQNKKIIIPNSVISSETIVNDNINEMEICEWLEFGISYDSDLDLAIKIVREEAMKHPLYIDNRKKDEIENGEHEIDVRLTAFGDSSVNLRALIWMKDPFHAGKMKSDILKRLKVRFDQEGIEIPFPYRTIVYKKDLPENKKLNNEEN